MKQKTNNFNTCWKDIKQTERDKEMERRGERRDGGGGGGGEQKV